MNTTMKRSQSFPLRLSIATRDHAKAVAQREGISLNHFISLAIAEKLTRIEHEHWLRRGSPTIQRQAPFLRPSVSSPLRNPYR